MLIFTSIIIFSQNSTVYIITGKIIDGEKLKPVPGAFVLNTNRLYGTQSDTSGKFRILMLKSDSIRISSIGYYTKYWKPDFSKAHGNFIMQNIYLKPQVYKLSPINIYALRWNAFVYDVKNTKVKENKVQKRITKWIDQMIEEENLADINLPTGIVIPLPIHTKYEKQLAKIQKDEKITKLNKMANEKFNKQLVARITGLKGKDLQKFMKYCSFDRNFILRTSEYDLIIIIQDIYKEYQENQKKQKNKNTQNH
jgi:hypothetical protein